MNRETYISKLESINEKLHKLSVQKLELIEVFQRECNHNDQYLNESYDYRTDEYGSNGYNLYNYSCSCCNSRARGLETKAKNSNEIRTLLKDAVQSSY